MLYVAMVEKDGTKTFGASGRVPLHDERDPRDLKSFQATVTTLLNEIGADAVGIKKKPHKGAMGAGPAAIKMEALLLASVSCDVQFFSPQHLAKKVAFDGGGLFKYLHDAARAALAVK